MNGSIRIRPARDSDSEALAAIHSAIRPEPVSGEEMHEWMVADESAPEPLHWAVADLEGQAVAVSVQGKAYWLPDNHYFIYVAVAKLHRNQGLGSMLYAQALDSAVAFGSTAIDSHCRGNDDASFEWAKRRGFVLERMRTESVLDLTTWQPGAFQPAVDKVRDSGLGIVVADEKHLEPYLKGLYTVDVETMHDVPAMREDKPPTYEAWLHYMRSFKGRRLNVMAFDKDLMIASTSIDLPRIAGQSAHVGYTAVLRQYRGRGVASAIKAVATTETAATGASRLRTNNDRDNPAILAINVKMGFREVPGPRMLRKRLSAEETQQRPDICCQERNRI